MTTGAMRSLDLPDEDWVEITMPGTTGAVRLARLHADPETGASVSLVRFPAGWTRPGVGHYAAAEELLVLEGEIEVAGPVRAGEYLFLPPRSVRADSVCRDGALVVAWFSGPPVWVTGEAPEPPAGPPVVAEPRGTMRAGDAEVPGEYAVLAGAASEPCRSDADVLDPRARTWSWVPAGHPLPQAAGPLHVRSWA